LKHFYTNRERCEVLTGCLSLGQRPGGNWANTWHWTNRFTIFVLYQKYQQPQVLPYRFLRRSFYWIIIILLYMYCVIIICIIDNNSVINNSYVRLQYLILPFKTSLGTQKNFFEIYRKFGHAPSESFASPGIGDQAKLCSPFHPFGARNSFQYYFRKLMS
jgi:hypothetical protein